MDRYHIGGVAFLTDANRRAIGQNLRRIYPVDDGPVFGKLFGALDALERNLSRRDP